MSNPNAKPWLKGAVGYEIYIRSFADASGDGTGDLKGIASKLDYLAWLGVDIVWVTPIYPSPGHDHGYDVSDYKAVNPIHGVIDDVDDLMAKAHDLGMRVIFDIVPNHSSIDHPWFRTALEQPESPERDMYLWRDPAPDGSQPNNWVSYFGGSAWTFHEATGQFYCHLFLPEQPDLNWRNPKVLEAFDDIYRFWFERGVDGFRIDVAHGMLKHESFADNEQIAPIRLDVGPMGTMDAFRHEFDMDQDDNVEIFQRWQKVASEYDAMLLAETGIEDHERIARYVGPGALDLTFFLKPAGMAWEPEALIAEHLGLATVEDAGIAWAISSHDTSRPVSRFGGGHQGRQRSLALSTMLCALGGVPFFYQGEELGLDDGIIASEHRQDPVSTRNEDDGGEGRDVCRTPIPWDDSPNNGFSTGTPWIVSQARPLEDTVDWQRQNSDAPVHRYRELIAARKRLTDLATEPMELLDAPSDQCASIRRGSVVTLANFSADPQTFALPDGGWTLEFSSSAEDADLSGGMANVPAESTVIVRTSAATMPN